MNSTESRQVVSVRDINRLIKNILENADDLQQIWIQGEISNFTHHRSGHMYFTLKDKDSRLKCIMFSSQNARLSFMPKEGMQVLARGEVSVYERDGQYQLYVRQMEPDGVGGLYLAYEQLKAKLQEAGYFDEARKKPLPRYPQRIGVVTSPTGAAVRDILITLGRRWPQADVCLFPVVVQGPQAAPEVAKAIRWFNRRQSVDVMIIGRGGGSLEELWAFNEMVVAESIYHSQIPIVSAVGHETDFTISDFAADVRAATPTAAAELTVPDRREEIRANSSRRDSLISGLSAIMDRRRHQLDRLQRSTVMRYPLQRILAPAQRLDRLKEQLNYRIERQLGGRQERIHRLKASLSGQHPGRRIEWAGQQHAAVRKSFVSAMENILKVKRREWLGAVRQLDALSPLNVLQRGYALAYDGDQQRMLKATGDTAPGEMIRVRLSDGQLLCSVWSIHPDIENEGGN